MPPPVSWPASLSQVPPAVEPAPITPHGRSLGIAAGRTPAEGGHEAIFFQGLPYHGKPTKVFGYIGLPRGIKSGGTCPAMVLLHGGGGTAFDVWVKLWNACGYAAITFDQCGDVPTVPNHGDGAPHARHEGGGPPGWAASFQQVAAGEPVEDTWGYHAVGAALAAHTLLASHPAVDADHIGLTGISWGGYLTCVVAGVDPRYRFAAPIYGCGYLGDNSIWSDPGGPGLTPELDMRTEGANRWVELWDPKNYLPSANMPMLWVNGKQASVQLMLVSMWTN
eukprot:SAG31_NODE_758_length_12292_cov_14.175511_5_plen_279_part_00